MDGKPALDLWDLIVTVLHGNTNQSKQERGDPHTNLVRVNPHKLPMRKKSHGMIDDTQRECQISKDVVDNYGSMFESRISARATEKMTENENTMEI